MLVGCMYTTQDKNEFAVGGERRRKRRRREEAVEGDELPLQG